MSLRAGPHGVGLLRTGVWDQVCRHIDGLAIGSTMAALDERGALEIIAANDRLSIGVLRRCLGANPGYLQVAVRLLADQGWITRTGISGTDTLMIEPTRSGRTAMGLAGGYTLAVGFLPIAEQLEEILFGSTDREGLRALAHFGELIAGEWELPRAAVPVHARAQVLHHLDGHLVAPLMSVLARHGILRAGPELRLDIAEMDGNRDALRIAFEVLARQGWTKIEKDVVYLTPAGVVAVAFARQYWYPMSYLQTFRHVPELLFGDPFALWCEKGRNEESNVDRELDIRFSSEVFTAICREPFLQIALPLFDRLPLEVQPTTIIDTGCGDGTLLETLYTAVRAKTERGRHLGDHPLLMVGVEPSPAARQATSARLARAEIPHAVVDGDITDPDALSRTLQILGLDPTNALHVNKSVIHNRTYRKPVDTVADAPLSCGAFASPDGSAILPTQMALNLTTLFRSWRQLAHRHGLLVIEAHSMDPARTADLIGRTIATALDSTHGYSNQYPVEPEVFYWAAQTAGFRSRAHRELGAKAVGHTALTVDHFITA